MENAKQISRPGHIPALDGIRGLAILLVILYHYAGHFRAWLPGWVGVDLFFVLSGYLITGRLTGTKGRSDYFLRFYRNRILRIFPIYYAVLILFFILILFFVHNHRSLYTWYFLHWKSFFIFTDNWSFIRYGFPTNLSLLPLWSVAVEEQFYLFWPLVIFLLPDSLNIRLRFFAFAFVSILVARCTFHWLSGLPAYYNTLLHMDGLVAGGALYVLHEKGIRLPSRPVTVLALATGIALIAFIIGYADASPGNPLFSTVGYSIMAILFFCLIDRAVQPGPSRITRFLQLGFLRYFGKISYGLYLVHVPVLLFVGVRVYTAGVNRWPRVPPDLIYLVSALVSLLLALVASALSYRYFESWFLRLKDKIH